MRSFRCLSIASAIASVVLFTPCATQTSQAQVNITPPNPQIGSSNPVTAAPPVARPSTRPCVVKLFSDLAFEDYTPKSFNYAPPAGCKGPWAKVVFTADFTVTAGLQYDRTGAFYIGHANVWYGTTAEPRSNLSPSWHVERDVTDLSAILKNPQTGEANLGNFVGIYDGTDYNGIIYANAALEFYPSNFANPAPPTPDIVIPVNGPGGDAGTLNTTTDQITQTLDLPKNVEKAYLDVITQNQIGDEFWYFCVPSNESANLESCGNTAFREAEVSIDGKPAGVAPTYPWIFTGGIDPFLWEPIPAVQTLDLTPYRVDLTPFAGVLADGSTHTVAVSVYNANGYFLATANLLVYTDRGSQKVTGGLISNTLADMPHPVITDKIKNTSSASTGSILTTSDRDFTIRGYVNTSHGRVETTLHQTVKFSNNQQFDVSATTDIQNLQQLNTVNSVSTVQDGFIVTQEQHDFSYPLNIDYSYVVNPDYTSAQKTSVQQGWTRDDATSLFGFPIYASVANESVKAADTLSFDANGNFTGDSGAKTTETYTMQNSLGSCYNRTLVAESLKLTSVQNGSCH